MFNGSGSITILKKLPIHLDSYIIITIDNVTLLIIIIPFNSIRDKTSSESHSSFKEGHVQIFKVTVQRIKVIAQMFKVTVS